MTRGDLVVSAPDGVPEIESGADLAALVVAHLQPVDGDVVAVTSKVVAKADGLLCTDDREDLIDRETTRVVARRGDTRIVRTRHGLVLAAAGVDASNLPLGTVAPLPTDPDASARAIRAGVRERFGPNVAVIVTDTIGRAWRRGQTDLAIGAAGLRVMESYAGRRDAHGNLLSVTEPAVADELAGAAELVSPKLSGRPLALLRGRADLVLPPGDDGPGAGALVRPEAEDLFGLGAREAVIRALLGRPEDLGGFGARASAAELVECLRATLGLDAAGDDHELRLADPHPLVPALAFAHGWAAHADDAGVLLTPAG